MRGMPALNGDGSQQTNADGSPKFVTWHLSDLDLARAMFSVRNADALIPLWPFVEDNRHGYVPGLRLLPQYRCVRGVVRWRNARLLAKLRARMCPPALQKRVGCRVRGCHEVHAQPPWAAGRGLQR